MFPSYVLVYVLVAIQTAEDKRRSALNSHRLSRISLADLPHTVKTADDRSTSPASHHSAEVFSSDNDSVDDSSHGSLDSKGDNCQKFGGSGDPIFDLAPFYTGNDSFSSTIKRTETISRDFDQVHKSITELCDSLHIHPKELPQRLDSILKSEEWDYTLSGNIVNIDCEDKPKVCKPSSNNTEGERFDSTYLYLGNFKREVVVPSAHKKDGDRWENVDSDYYPMGMIKRPDSAMTKESEMATGANDPTKVSPKLKQSQETGKLLQLAINSHDREQAQLYAGQLADDHVEVNIQVKVHEEHVAQEQEFE